MKGRRGREYGRHFSLASTGTLKGHVTLQDVLCLRDSSPSKILARHALLFLLLSLGSLFSLSLFFSLPAFSYCHLCSSLAFQDYIPPFRAGSKTIRPPLASSAAKTFSQVSTRAIIDFFLLGFFNDETMSSWNSCVPVHEFRFVHLLEI